MSKQRSKVSLTSTQVDIARRLGITPEVYARGLMDELAQEYAWRDCVMLNKWLESGWDDYVTSTMTANGIRADMIKYLNGEQGWKIYDE
jgi:hypothetical protein